MAQCPAPVHNNGWTDEVTSSTHAPPEILPSTSWVQAWPAMTRIQRSPRPPANTSSGATRVGAS